MDEERRKQCFWSSALQDPLRVAPEGSWLWLESDGREAGPSLSDTSRELCPSAASVDRGTKVGMEPKYEIKLETEWVGPDTRRHFPPPLGVSIQTPRR